MVDQLDGFRSFRAESPLIQRMVFKPLHFCDPTPFHQNIHATAVITDRAICRDPFRIFHPYPPKSVLLNFDLNRVLEGVIARHVGQGFSLDQSNPKGLPYKDLLRLHLFSMVGMISSNRENPLDSPSPVSIDSLKKVKTIS
jgi:hypothetical protein